MDKEEAIIPAGASKQIGFATEDRFIFVVNKPSRIVLRRMQQGNEEEVRLVVNLFDLSDEKWEEKLD
jgi:hypothetical protein